jgi:tetratricopeptide (TPR) repeat protein
LATLQLGDADEAARLIGASLEFFAECGDRRGIAFALTNLGELATRRGDYAEAERCHGQDLALRRASGDHWGVADSLNQLGRAARLAGNRSAAEGHFLEALGAASAGKLRPLLLDILVELAILEAEAGERDRALHVLQAVLRDPAMARQTRDTGMALLTRLGGESPALPRGSVSLETVDAVADALLQARPLPHNA